MKFFHPLVIFLDDDLQRSAKSFNNEFLELNIKHTIQVLFCGLFYFIGIRNKKFHKYYFDKDRKDESLHKWFPGYPYKKVPSFVYYNSPESRWVRKCADHFMYLTEYLGYMLDEFEIRQGKSHPNWELHDFFTQFPIKLNLMAGIRIPYANLKKIVIPWKNLPLQYRKKNIIEGYRRYYRSVIYDPMTAYFGSKCDIPKWLMNDQNVFDEI